MEISVDVFNSLFLFSVKVVVILAIVHWLVEQSRDLSAARARSCLAYSALAVLAIPVLAWCLPALPVLVVPQILAYWAEVPLVAQSRGQLTYNGVLISVLGVYLVVASWWLCYMMLGIAQVARIDRRAGIADAATRRLAAQVARNLGLLRAPQIKISGEVVSPQVWGWRQPVVLLPQHYTQWSEGRLRRVLTHELAHVERFDWPVQMALHMAATLFWFIPSIWLTLRRSAWYAELACDDWVVRLEGRADYASDLMAFAADDENPGAIMGALSLVTKRSVYARINAVLDGTRVRTPARFIDHVGGCLLVLALVLSVAPATAVVSKTPNNVGGEMDLYRLVLVPAHQAPLPNAPQTEAPSSAADDALSPQEMKALLTSVSLPPPMQEEVIILGKPVTDSAAIKPKTVALDDVMATANITMDGPVPVVTTLPQYPPRALRRGIEGSVTVVFDVAITGKPENIRIARQAPSAVFNHAVLDAVKQFRFRPQIVDGQQIITKNITETFVFQLIDGTTDNHIQPNRQHPEA